MGLYELFVTASMPMLKMLLLSVVGSVFATDQVSILGQNERRALNNVVFYIFNPALVAGSLSHTFSLETMVLLWFMPVNLILDSLVGSALGWSLLQITKAPKKFRTVILATCSAGNVGNLFLVLLPAMCKEKASPFQDRDVCEKYAMAYASLSLAICTIWQWSYVYSIIRISQRSIEGKQSNYTSDKQHLDDTRKLSIQIYSRELHKNEQMVLCCSSIHSAPILAEYAPKTNRIKINMANKVNVLLQRLSEAVEVKKLFAPSTIGVIAGLVVGATPQLKEKLVGEGAPLRFLQDSITLLGNGTIPSLILITGGNLIKGINGPGIGPSLIIGVVLIRFVLLPIVGTIFVEFAAHVGLVHSDPLFHLVILLQHAVPPAMNTASMIQMLNAGESELSVIFFWSYIVATVGITLWSMLFLWFVS